MKQSLQAVTAVILPALSRQRKSYFWLASHIVRQFCVHIVVCHIPLKSLCGCPQADEDHHTFCVQGTLCVGDCYGMSYVTAFFRGIGVAKSL